MTNAPMTHADARARNRGHQLADDKRLVLRVDPRSPKYWRLEYRRPAKETLRAIGACPETSLAEVVAAAGEARKPIEASTSLSGCS